MRFCCRGFSLIELMAVTVLMAAVVGAATLNMRGVSEAARLQSAMEQVAACVKMASSEASRTGRPHAVVLGGRSCAISRPVLHCDEQRTGQWVWKHGASFDLPPKIDIRCVNQECESNGAPTRIPMAAGQGLVELRVRFQTAAGREIDTEFSGWASALKYRVLAERKE